MQFFVPFQFPLRVAHFSTQITLESGSMRPFHMVSEEDSAQKFALTNVTPIIFMIEAVHLQVVFTLERFSA